MTLTIISLLQLVLYTVSLPHHTRSSPTHLNMNTDLLDQSCPCTEANHCDVKFGISNPAAHLSILRIIPACPSFQGRCCSTETMLLAIIDLSSNSFHNQEVFPNTPPKFSTVSQNSRSNLVRKIDPAFRHNIGLTCVPEAECSPNKVYGTNLVHFEQFGYISPSDSNCLASEEMILCVPEDNQHHPQTEDSQVTNQQEAINTPGSSQVSAQVPAVPAPITISNTQLELSCLPPTSCQEIYGTKVEHFDCPDVDQVRCAQPSSPATTTTPRPSSPTTPSPPTVELPCVLPSSCQEVYGILGIHFTEHGTQLPCPGQDDVRCVTLSSSPSLIPSLTPAHPSDLLPCVQPDSCSEVYGTLGSHFTEFGLQLFCPNSATVRCVTTSTPPPTTPTSTPPPTAPPTPIPTSPPTSPPSITPAHSSELLPCLEPSSCLEVYGTLGSHFTQFGLQVFCPDSETVRCVTATTSSPPVTTVPVTPASTLAPPVTVSEPSTEASPTIHPLFTTQAPVLAPVVHIIGPRPVYISLNDIRGPSSASHRELDSSGSIQSTSNIDQTKQDQVRDLLKLLENQLKHILVSRQ
eukprot:GFUD01103984.1.p1 GENE.GFUD01103984.1~~GFUD01103984.1.p1  ORF type:complete len:576 (-),score=115.06 GFUD01103984.1:341-2068(-)